MDAQGSSNHRTSVARAALIRAAVGGLCSGVARAVTGWLIHLLADTS